MRPVWASLFFYVEGFLRGGHDTIYTVTRNSNEFSITIRNPLPCVRLCSFMVRPVLTVFTGHDSVGAITRNGDKETVPKYNFVHSLKKMLRAFFRFTHSTEPRVVLLRKTGGSTPCASQIKNGH